MHIFTASILKKEILIAVEEKLGRKLTDDEMKVFHLSARLGLIKGEQSVK
jgi:hypothetical protein